LFELRDERRLAAVARPVQELDLARTVRKALHHRAERRDANAAGDQEQPPPGPSRAMDGAIGTFEHDRSAGPKAAQIASPLAELLDREPKVLAVRRGRDAEGMAV